MDIGFSLNPCPRKPGALYWIDSPFFESSLARSDLDEPTKEIVRAYANDGYLIIDPELPEFDRLADEIIDACLCRQEYQTRLMDEWERVPAVKTLAVAPKVSPR